MAEITFPSFWIWPEITPKNTKSDNGRGGGYKTSIPGYLVFLVAKCKTEGTEQLQLLSKLTQK